MVDKKTQFVLSLQGKEDKGFMEHWAVVSGELTGLVRGHYHLLRKYKIVDSVAVGADRYYTLGKECTHKEMVGIYSDKSKRAYDPDDGIGHEPYKCWD